MNGSGIVRNALFALALISFSAPPADAIEIVGGSSQAAHLDAGLFTTVAVHRGGGHRGGGIHRPAGRPGGAHRPSGRPGGGYRPGGGHRPSVPGNRPGPRPGVPGHRPGGPGNRPGRPVNRPVVVRPGGVWVARPSSYRWSPGGAIAAGAALGFVRAAAASAWAGAPPQAGLCWYYTDPSRRQGFWDVCP
jgi:hypothetical protein